jgi:hypothetical protein
MRWNTDDLEAKAEERLESECKWHEAFAWFPKKVTDTNDYVWLEKIYRKRRYRSYDSSYDYATLERILEMDHSKNKDYDDAASAPKQSA